MAESILIVDDEESVRRTFHDWLSTSGLGCEIHSVADAESALLHANQHAIDLAILDWNLGTGSDGLSLLEDLVEFHPDIVAIMVTGFAHQATPLDALRMGVRDYLDKNQDLNRETFLAAVRRQLERIIPAKRQRQFTRGLLQFREAVDKVLPLVRASAAMNDPVPLPQAIKSLFQFLLRTTQADSGVLLAHHVDTNGVEIFRAYDHQGEPLPPLLVPFSRSLAASVASMQEASVMNRLASAAAGSIELLPFEAGRRNALAAPMPVGAGTLVVLELFDRANGQDFTEEDRRIVAAAADFGSELIRQALAERQTHRTLFDAVEEALRAGSSIADSLPEIVDSRPEAPPSAAVLDRLKEGLRSSGTSLMDAETSIRLAEAVRVLALRHGPAAVKHCVAMVESLRRLLDEMIGG
ncbi:MAG: response regulator [Planctomycetes bacterium]|nr:response regulator [Planctomycetota bacterium]